MKTRELVRLLEDMGFENPRGFGVASAKGRCSHCGYRNEGKMLHFEDDYGDRRVCMDHEQCAERCKADETPIIKFRN